MSRDGSYGLTMREYYIMNTMFLAAHVIFFFWYLIEKMPVLFYYNIFSVVVFAVMYLVLKKSGPRYVIPINFSEILVFMTLNIIFLGWSYGFQFYCIGFTVSALIADFILLHRRNIPGYIKGGMVFLVIYYISFYVWTHTHDPIYTHGNHYLRIILYLVNTIATFALIVSLLRSSMLLVYDLEDKLEEIATHDVLTGLHNRRYMQNYLQKWQQDHTKEDRAWVAIVDIDHFKNINDTYGHFAGDAVLQRLGEILLSMEKEHPGLSTARWGGEEFFLLYAPAEKTSEKEVIRFLEQFRERFGTEPLHYEGTEFTCSITIGAAGTNEYDLDEAQKKADERLYWGKEHGRNQVVYRDIGVEIS